MSDIPMAVETPVKPTLKDLAQPTPAAPASAESPPHPPEKPPELKNARSVLQEIAAGPQPEQTAELGPNKEKVNSILTAGTQLLLDAGDHRATLTALARQAAPTPLGTELRRDVIHAIAEMKPTKLTPEQTATLTNLQKDIAALELPKTDSAKSEFAKFLEEYSQQNPDKAIPAPIIEAVRTNRLDRAAQMANILQSDTTLSAKLNEQFKGDRIEPLANVATPDGLLKAAGLSATPENMANATKLLEPPPPPDPKSTRKISDMAMSTLMFACLATMFMSQFTGSGGSEAGGGHQ